MATGICRFSMENITSVNILVVITIRLFLYAGMGSGHYI